jgi:hypothetical protein
MEKATLNVRQLLAVFGSVILLIGAFLPLAELPIIGEINLFNNAKDDGVFVLPLAVGSFIAGVMKTYRALWVTGLMIIVIIIQAYVNIQYKLDWIEAQMDKKLADNPFRGLADAAIASVQMEYGWGFLLLGTMLIISAAAWSMLQSKPGADC